MGLIWGIPYLLIKIAVADLSPATIVLGRTLIAAVILVPIAAAGGHLRPLLPYWKPLIAYTVVEICVPWVLLGYAEQTLSSSLTGLLVAAVPLVGALLVWASGHETLSRRRIGGLLVGFAGVAALVGFDLGAADLGAILAMAGVAFGYALGPLILARHLAHLPALGVVAASIALSALAYLPVGLLQWPDRPPSRDAVFAVVGLAIICTGLAFIIFFALVTEVGPARATVITYVNPVVAVALGVLILGEAITPTIVLGFALILVGSVLATTRERGRGTTAAVSPAATPPGTPGTPTTDRSRPAPPTLEE